MGKTPLTQGEEDIMKHTFRTTMLRAADIIDRITESDVVDAQAELLSQGVSLERVSKVDRASLASAHLRACVKASAEKARRGEADRFRDATKEMEKMEINEKLPRNHAYVALRNNGYLIKIQWPAVKSDQAQRIIDAAMAEYRKILDEGADK